jgi:hypothetical protein
MSTRIISEEYQRAQLLKLIQGYSIPFTVSITKGRKKSYLQDKLENLWHMEACEQLDDGEAPEEKRAYAKLHFGVAIMHSQDDEFRESWDRVLRGLTYPQKIEAMRLPLDFPVTRLMTSKQKSEYLEALQVHYENQGVVLTQPEG